jgi:hypothetical protein
MRCFEPPPSQYLEITMHETPTTPADPPPFDPERQARLTADAMAAMRELVARIPRRFDHAAEPEALFVPRRSKATAARGRRGQP